MLSVFLELSISIRKKLERSDAFSTSFLKFSNARSIDISSPMWVGLTDILLSTEFSAMSPYNWVYSFVTEFALSWDFVCSPSMSIVAENPCVFKFLTMLITSLGSYPAMYDLENSLINHLGIIDTDEASILFIIYFATFIIVFKFNLNVNYCSLLFSKH